MTAIKTVFMNIWAWIINCYDNSFFEKCMSAIFGFFQKGSEDSKIVNFFRYHFSNGNIWGKSNVAKTIRYPFAACRRFYHKHEKRIQSIKEKSIIYSFWCDIANISFRDYGKIILCTAAGLFVSSAFFNSGDSILNIAVSVGFAFIGGFLCLSDKSYNELAMGSQLVKALRKTTAYYDEYTRDLKKTIHISLILPCAFSTAIGVIAAPLGIINVLVGILIAVMILIIMKTTEVGVFLFVPLSAILPTMVLAGIIIITFISYILHLLLGKKTEYVSTAFQPWIALFIALAAYSAITSPVPVSSIKVLMIYLIFTIAYVLVVSNIKTRSQWSALVLLCVGATALVALVGIYQNFFLTETTQSWVDSKMFTDIKTRVYGTLDNPNVLGEYFILMIPIAFVMILKMHGSVQKMIYAALNALMFICLMYTWSRGAWIGVVIGLAFFVILKDRRWIVMCVAGLLIMPSVLPADIMTRLMSIGNMKDSSTAYRVAVWIGSARMIKDYWFCGIGLGSDAFLKVYPQYALGGADFALHSHNFYLQWIVDMGIVGIIAYAGIIMTAFKEIFSVREKNTLIKNVLLAMSGAIWGYLFHGIAENLWYNYRMVLVFWVYLGILQSGVLLSDERKTRKEVMV